MDQDETYLELVNPQIVEQEGGSRRALRAA